MTKEEFESLKKGDIITHQTYGGYYVVLGTFDDFIDCQGIQDVGISSEFGYEHTRFGYPYCNPPITDSIFREAVSYVLSDEGSVVPVDGRNDFLAGIEWMLKHWSDKVFEEAYRVYNKDYSTGEYCHEQSFLWGFQEGYQRRKKNDDAVYLSSKHTDGHGNM